MELLEDIMDQKWGRPDDPTPVEIAAATAGIRANWSDDEFRVRAGLSEYCPWQPPVGRSALIRLFQDEF